MCSARSVSANESVESAKEKQIKSELSKPLVSVPPVDTTKRCPLCAETIKADAKICRFCGFDFAAGTRTEVTSKSAPRSNNHLRGIFLLLSVIVLMVGGYIAYSVWSDRENTSAKRPLAVSTPIPPAPQGNRHSHHYNQYVNQKQSTPAAEVTKLPSAFQVAVKAALDEIHPHACRS